MADLKLLPKIELSDASLENAAKTANAILNRSRGGEITKESEEANEFAGEKRFQTFDAAKTFLRTLKDLAPSVINDKIASKKFWDLAKKHFKPLSKFINQKKNPIDPINSDYPEKIVIKSVEDSIVDKSLINQIRNFEKALNESDIAFKEPIMNLLQLTADEPQTVAMRELSGNSKKKENQLKLADPNFKDDSGPVTIWHITLLVDSLVAAVQIARKGFVKGITDPITIGVFLATSLLNITLSISSLSSIFGSNKSKSKNEPEETEGIDKTNHSSVKDNDELV